MCWSRYGCWEFFWLFPSKVLVVQRDIEEKFSDFRIFIDCFPYMIDIILTCYTECFRNMYRKVIAHSFWAEIWHAYRKNVQNLFEVVTKWSAIVQDKIRRLKIENLFFSVVFHERKKWHFWATHWISFQINVSLSNVTTNKNFENWAGLTRWGFDLVG